MSHVSIIHSFLLLSTLHCVNISQFVHSSVEEHLNGFHFEDLTHKFAVNVSVWVFLWTYVVSFLLGKDLGVE